MLSAQFSASGVEGRRGQLHPQLWWAGLGDRDGKAVLEADSEGVEKGDLGPHLHEKRRSGSHTVLAVVRGKKIPGLINNQ